MRQVDILGMKLAVIKTGGKQYLIKEGDKLKLEKINAKEGGDISAKSGSASGGEDKFSLSKLGLEYAFDNRFIANAGLAN